MPERVVVIGVSCDDGRIPSSLAPLVARCDLVVGGRRHLDRLAPPGSRTAVIGADVGAALDTIEAEDGVVCVLASGDPGFFGFLRPLASRLGPERLEVHPAVSAVAAAFARVGLPWDDAVVVSAHGRPLDDAVNRAATAAKVAVLTSPDNPPEALGKALVTAGGPGHRVVVCSRLGADDESVTDADLDELAAGGWDPLSVVLLLGSEPVAGGPTLAWGLPVDRFEHRSSMITKAEVRAVALGKLGLPPTGVLWDVGAGSGSVAIEASRLAPGLEVYAVERDRQQAERAGRNASAHGASVRVVNAEAPAGLAGLPDPDRVFVGGGGVVVLEAALARLRPGGRIVATYAAVDRAAAAAHSLGHVVQVAVSRGEHLPDGGIRLAADNPVFVAWGPDE
ncbi:MAG TPA: precorrin-6y C5,15-methyltransferase (decarboxylating) subunit CbiE [Acidimicrobiales bacterium]|nr:precorrin-6y C5,15-methyltransferase (decarboxylating) subunit CbiE [Acidimicrobiales bacterium]